MKELTIEQKAQRYDEAIEQLRTIMPNWENLSYNGKTFLQDLVHIIPELKESKGEKIRKWLIEYFKNINGEVAYEDREKIIAWLEKQGQTFTKKDVDDAYLKGICDAKHELEKQGEQQDVSLQINPSEYINDMGGNGCYLKNTTQTSAWSEEDCLQLDAAISIIANSGHTCTSDWLKSLKERVQPQSKQEWDKDDDKHCDRILKELREQKQKPVNAPYIELIDSDIDWLKSLKDRVQPQNTWKPSDEQMKVLNEVLYFSANHESPNWNDYIFGTLNNLIRQLKKLRGE